MALIVNIGETRKSADALVQSFVSSGDAEESERALVELLSEHAEPQIRRMVRHKLAFAGPAEQQDIDDLCAEILSELLYQLRQIKADPERSIQSFSSYTSVTAYRAFSDYLRRKYPQRHRLKMQLRYLFKADKRLKLWETPQHVWLCGLSQWKPAGDFRKIPTAEELHRVADEFPRRSADFVAKLLDRLAAPIEMDDLVRIVGELWGVSWQTDVPLNEDEPAKGKPSATAASCVELKDWLARLWIEVRELPLMQRRALLLNLRDEQGGSALLLIPICGVASIREIAKVLEMEDGELASLWNALPIDDLQLAERLGLTRQQVINLRKSARARLTRRMSPQ